MFTDYYNPRAAQTINWASMVHQMSSLNGKLLINKTYRPRRQMRPRISRFLGYKSSSYTFSKTLWTGDRPVAKSCAHRRQDKRRRKAHNISPVKSDVMIEIFESRSYVPEAILIGKIQQIFISLFHRAFQLTIYNGPTKTLVCNKTLMQMSHIKTLKITPTCFDQQLIIIRELSDAS
jgi:hypothetical protein